MRPCAASNACDVGARQPVSGVGGGLRVTSMTTAGAISCCERHLVGGARAVFEKWIGASRCVPPCSGVQSL